MRVKCEGILCRYFRVKPLKFMKFVDRNDMVVFLVFKSVRVTYDMVVFLVSKSVRAEVSVRLQG